MGELILGILVSTLVIGILSVSLLGIVKYCAFLLRGKPVILEIDSGRYVINIRYVFGLIPSKWYINISGKPLVIPPDKFSTVLCVFKNSTELEKALLKYSPPKVTFKRRKLNEIKTEDLLNE